MPWSPELSDDPTPSLDRYLTVGWLDEAEGVRISHEIHFDVDQTIEGIQIPWAPITRVFCHFLVSQIPDQGLAELCESVADMYRFYSTKGESPPLLPQTERISGVSGRTYERPEFHLETE